MTPRIVTASFHLNIRLLKRVLGALIALVPLSGFALEPWHASLIPPKTLAVIEYAWGEKLEWTPSAKNYHSLDDAIDSFGRGIEIHEIIFQLNGSEWEGDLQSDVRSFLASRYPDDYSTVVKSTVPGQSATALFRSRIGRAVLASRFARDILETLARHCLAVRRLDIEKASVRGEPAHPVFHERVALMTIRIEGSCNP